MEKEQEEFAYVRIAVLPSCEFEFELDGDVPLSCSLFVPPTCYYYFGHAQRHEHRPRRGRGELASIIQHARDGQRGPGACDWQGRPGATLLARVRRPRRKVRLQ